MVAMKTQRYSALLWWTAHPQGVCHALLLQQLPAEYFQYVLGRQMRQSCCLYPDAELTLDEAEDSMLGALLVPQTPSQLHTPEMNVSVAWLEAIPW